WCLVDRVRWIQSHRTMFLTHLFKVTTMQRFKVLFPAAGLLLLVLFGCAGDTTGPFSNLSATNNPDDFVFIGQTYGKAVTTTLNYTWKNTGNVGQIAVGNQAVGGAGLSTPAGAGTIVVKDAAGTQVYTHDLTTDAADTTSSGSSGDWTIILTFT